MITEPSLLTDSKDMRFRFAQNIFAVIVVSALLLLGLEQYHYYEARQRLLEALPQQQQQAGDVLQRNIQQAYNYLSFIHATPPVAALVRSTQNGGVDPASGSTQTQWQQRLQQILSAYMSHHGDIHTIRYTTYDGETLAFISRHSGDLTSHGSNRHVEAATWPTLKPGQFYVSAPYLARRQQQLVYPLWPALQIALPVFDSDKSQPFGYLSFTLDATSLLQQLRTSVASPYQLLVTDQRGHFLLHPQRDWEFAHELGSAKRWQQQYPSANSRPISAGIQAFEHEGNRFYWREQRLPLGSPELGRQLVLYTRLPEAGIWQEVQQRRGTALIVTSVLIGLVLMFMLGYQRFVATRLRWLAAQAQLLAVVENANDAVVMLGLDGTIISANRATESLFGQHQASLMGQSVHGTLLPEDSDSPTEQQLRQALQQRRALKVQTSGCYEDHTFPLALTLMPIVAANGRYIGASLTLHDLSEQSVLTERLQQQHRQQLKQQQQQLQDTQQALTDARQLNKSKERLLAAISHEIRTPMNSIQGVLNLLAKGPLNADQQHYVQMASSSMQHAAQLINDVLDYAKVRSGNLFIEEVEYSLTAVLTPVVKRHAEQAFNKGLTLLWDTSSLAYDRVRGDPTRLRQVVDNLLSNAVKFTRHGYVYMEISSAEAQDYGIELHCRIRDTGIGLEPDQQQHLFSAFDEKDQHLHERLGGVGLGLALSQRLCQLMGGEITVNSQPEQGSCFEFSLNVSAASGNCHHPLHRDGGYADSRWLLRLDDGLQADVLARMIRRRGGDVVIADGGENSADFDVLITEVRYLSDYASALQSKTSTHVMALTPPGHLGNTLPDGLRLIELPQPVTQEELALAYIHANGDACSEAILSSQTGLADSQRFQQQRVLVVDDDDVNLEVVSSLLSDMGLRCDTANHGGAALERLVHSELFDPYLLILMDCQMPLIDGYSATRRIRQGEAGARYEQIPVIAVTAAAQPEDRQRCISAGMNDYIVKPMAADQLRHLLSQWLERHTRPLMPPPASQPQTNPLPTSETTTTSNARSGQVWDKDGALQRLNHNASLLRRVVELFQQKANQQLLTLSLNHGDLTSQAATVHTLKGASANAGAEQLSQRLQQLQQALEQEQAQPAQVLLEQAKTDYRAFIDAVANDSNIAGSDL
ncbi:hypothetical protein GCM10011297_05300 [Bacterioplanes sanyensis]|uniref:ATP-binding protein n=1 Tax=Bacterioplanes sanyensis TaxID=1249553 RepID=UPI001676D02B|nr:ATP-binding protein [Bacterioplanes sanyensis]GGY35182.1 hypothetical protein GCM10011297_05300 [Bacterioplanes sanyensis]